MPDDRLRDAASRWWPPLGFLLALVLDGFPASRYLRPFVATGFLGAYATFSTFNFDTLRLVEEGAVSKVFANAAGTFVTCAAALGLALGGL